MNNLYRDLAPITEVAWTEIETEAARTFKRHIAGRRVVDVSEPGGPVTAAVSTGHLLDVASPGDGVVAHLRDARPLVRLRVPFTVNRVDVDDVERGSQDSDWDPVKDAARKLAFIEDRAIFEGYEAAHIGGIRKCSSNPALALPEDPREIPDVIAQALSELRLAGVDGPYSVLLSADVYTQVSETTAHGYPIRDHISRLVDGDIIWAPAIDGAFVLSTRGGDFDLQLGTDVSIGYLSHDADTVQLYLQETHDVPVLHRRGVGRADLVGHAASSPAGIIGPILGITAGSTDTASRRRFPWHTHSRGRRPSSPAPPPVSDTRSRGSWPRQGAEVIVHGRNPERGARRRARSKMKAVQRISSLPTCPPPTMSAGWPPRRDRWTSW